MPCAAIAMQLKQLMSCMLLIFTLWSTCLHLSVSQPFLNDTTAVWGPICGSGQYANGSLFHPHLNQVLESLVGNVSISGFNTSTVEGQTSNSTVYGLLQCRGDLSPTKCQQCASTTKAALVEKCQNNTSGFILLDGCFLRYDNHNFYNYNEASENYTVCSPPSSDQIDQFAIDTLYVLSNICKTAVQNPKHFAAHVFDVESSPSKLIYSLAQCWRDLSRTSCQSCLAVGRSNITANSYQNGCVTGAGGGQFHTMGCDLRYETYQFYTPILSPPPLVSPGDSPPKSSPREESPPQSSPREESPPQSSPLSEYKILAITLGVVAAAVGLIAAIYLYRFSSKRRETISRLRGDDGEISLSPTIANPELVFKYDTLREATSNFKAENKLGEGGFGSVFKGVLPDYRQVAVKRLKIGSRQGDNEFLNEANLISRVQHKNLVKLLGCSVESSERLLVYEYLQNSSLDKIIFDTTKRHLLDWRERYEIIVGIARGLAYLHEESEIRIIHRDIKASNILLDNKYRPKIADFGLAKLFAEDESHVSTRVAGTLGYMAPESLRGHLTEKADVFSFGVLVLEIISGRKSYSFPHHMDFLIDATWRLYNAERAIEVMDPTLMNGSYSWEEGVRVIKIGLLCTQAGAALRPSMSRVVSMLTSDQEHIPLPTRPAFVDPDCEQEPIPSPTRPAFVELDCVIDAPEQVERGRVTLRQDPSSSTQSSGAANYNEHIPSPTNYERTPSNIHSAAADPSSGIMEPR